MKHPRHASRSAARVEPFLAMEILERAQELERDGADVVHLEVGEPDFDVPPAVRRAMEEAGERGLTHYTHSLGDHEFREEVSRYYQRLYGVRVAPERILATAGTSGGLVLLMAHLLDPGDEVLIPDPGYACYPNFVRAFHGEPRRFRVRAEERFRYDPEKIRGAMSERSKALFVNSPSNPTAVIQDRATLERLAGLEVAVISDEIYHGLEYGKRAASMLEVTDDCYVVDGLSKRYAMTGLRIGWLVAPADDVRSLQRLQQNLFVCASSTAQQGAIAALRSADRDLETMREEYAERRRLLLDGLRRLGLPVPGEPEGAYYILADARAIDGDSLRLTRRILEEAHVGVTPGIDFGPSTEGYLRFSFAASKERIREGLGRLGRWLGRG